MRQKLTPARADITRASVPVTIACVLMWAVCKLVYGAGGTVAASTISADSLRADVQHLENDFHELKSAQGIDHDAITKHTTLIESVKNDLSNMQQDLRQPIKIDMQEATGGKK